MPLMVDMSRCDQATGTSFSNTVVPLFQPIYALKQGRVAGFEALARLAQGDELVAPKRFLSRLNPEELSQLFRVMLSRSVAFMRRLDPRGRLYVSVNVNASLVQQDSFVDLVGFILDEHGFQPSRLILEILESEAIDSLEVMATSIRRLRALGVGVALDDVGSAYASLAYIRDLPVDIVKLDQGFSRLLSNRPSDLHFVASMVGLARRLGRTLVVEGAETPGVVDALRMTGVEYAQGYALARPMLARAVPRWLAGSEIRPAARGPCTLLGAYAAHLAVVEAYHVLADPSLRARWGEGCGSHRCGVGHYIDDNGLRRTALGEAHDRFHRKLGTGRIGGLAGKAAAELGQAFLVALKAEAAVSGGSNEDRTKLDGSAASGSVAEDRDMMGDVA